MAAPATRDAFLDIVRKSGLVAEGDLEGYLEANPALPGDPPVLAGRLVRDGLLTTFQAKQLLQGRHRGFVFGKYKVLEQIGAGGMGAVYLCEHTLMKRRVAIKVLPQDKAADPVSLERFYREGRAAAALDHPNIVRAHDIDQEGTKMHFLVMEFVDGRSLHDIVKDRGPLTLARTAHYLAQACKGLEHAHAKGLVHRDIKPANLLLDRAGTVKILDMGLARFFADTRDAITQQLDSAAVLGTADYISPEQAMNSSAVDIRADLYSLGATAYYLLTGAPPFPEGSVAQKLLAHQLKQPPPLTQVRPDTPAPFAEVVARMMAKNPAERFQTPAEVLAALAPWTGEPVPPPAPDEMPRLSAAVARQTEGGPPSTGKLRPQPSSASVKFTLPTPQPGRDSGSKISLFRGHDSGIADVPTARLADDGSVTPADGRRADSGLRRADSALRKARASGKLKKKPKRRSATWWALAVGGPVLLVAVAGLLVWRLGGKPRPLADEGAPGAVGGRNLMVLPQEGNLPPGAFRTFREALAQAKPNDRILINGDLEEPLMDQGQSLFGPHTAGVTVEPGRTNEVVVWRFPAKDGPAETFLRLRDQKGLTFKRITFDGRGKVEDLLTLEGSSAGLTLEQVHLTGFKRAAVRCLALHGDSTSPVQFQRVRVTAAGGADAAMVFQASAGGRSNSFIHVEDGRFEGPFQTAFRVESSMADFVLRRNRVYQAEEVLHYRKADPLNQLMLTFAGNTVGECGVGLHLDVFPAGAPNTALKIEQNLFYRTRQAIRVDDQKAEPPAGTRAAWIWADDAGQPAGPGRCFRKVFEWTPGGPPTFLDAACADHFKAWVNGQPAGEASLNPVRRQVSRLDVTRQLKAGPNVLVLEARGAADAPGLLARVVTGDKELAVTDASWQVGPQIAPEVHQPAWPAEAWRPARVLCAYGQGPGAWRGLVWEGYLPALNPEALARVLPGLESDPAKPTIRNFLDQQSQEGFPRLAVGAMPLTLGTDAADDATFLRYPKNHPLATAINGQPAGVPPP